MAKKRKKTAKGGFSFDMFDDIHLANLLHQQGLIDALFNYVSVEAARIGVASNFRDAEKRFKLKDFPSTKKRVDELIATFATKLTNIVESGNEEEWLLSERKNAAMVDALVAKTNIPRETIEKWKAHNADALSRYKDEGRQRISDRIWQTSEQARAHIEMSLDVGLGEGKSAATLSREIRKDLKEPHRLFRRVRDKNGNLTPSQNALAYHPGQGVYRSAYKNALRLTATENNMAYRTADYEKWNQLDIVIGMRIRLSNNHTLNGVPFHDICDDLVGVYPKTFKFVGWHPFCRCIAEPIVASWDEQMAKMKAERNGEDVSDWHYSGEVVDMPNSYKQWMDDNQKRIDNAKNKPKFITDNNGKSVNALTSKDDNIEHLTSIELGKIMNDGIPYGLRKGGAYLGDDSLDKNFFTLLDKSKDISLELVNSENISFSSLQGDLVHIEVNNKRILDSKWKRKAVVYHEYGHCIDAQRELWQNEDFVEMRNKHISLIHNKTKQTLYVNNGWSEEKGYEYVMKTFANQAEYIDTRLKNLEEKIWGMNAETFAKRGISRQDVIEQIGGTRDFLQSLDSNYGAGHTKKYLSHTRMSETEYIAHSFENAFIGNTVFQKVMPTIYDDVVTYIKSLKP